MPLYGSVDGAKALLRSTVTAQFNVDHDARLAALRPAVSAWIEEQTGRTFGSGPVSTTQLATGTGRDLLLLADGVRSVTGVVAGPEWSGSAWTGGDPVPAAQYRLVLRNRQGLYAALQTTDGDGWHGEFAVTGVYAGSPDAAGVPDDITYVANYLIAERFKIEQASPNGAIGPDGTVLPIRNVLADPLVKDTIAKYAVRQVIRF